MDKSTLSNLGGNKVMRHSFPWLQGSLSVSQIGKLIGFWTFKKVPCPFRAPSPLLPGRWEVQHGMSSGSNRVWSESVPQSAHASYLHRGKGEGAPFEREQELTGMHRQTPHKPLPHLQGAPSPLLPTQGTSNFKRQACLLQPENASFIPENACFVPGPFKNEVY